MSSPKLSAAKVVGIMLRVKRPAPLHQRPPTNRRERRLLARVLQRAKRERVAK